MTTHEFYFSHSYSQHVNLQSQNESTSSESIQSERESAIPLPNNNAIDNESNYSSDNSESDLDGECPAEPTNTGFTSPQMIKDDHRIYNQSRYENMYSWLYYSQSLHGYMCKICDIYYGSSLCPTNSNRGAWSYKPVTFHDNAGKKLRCHNSTESHKQAILGLVNLRIEDNIGSQAKEKSQEQHEANNLYIGKLIHIVEFFARNNLPVKGLYQKFIEFLSNELDGPIIKQYLENCSKNATYKSHKTCDSLIASLDSFFRWETNERIRRSADIVLFTDESTNAA